MVDPDVFGKPGEGLHAYRFGGLAIVDVILTLVFALLGGFLYSRATNASMLWSCVIAVIILFSIGIVAHRVVGVKTAGDTWLRSL